MAVIGNSHRLDKMQQERVELIVQKPAEVNDQHLEHLMKSSVLSLESRTTHTHTTLIRGLNACLKVRESVQGRCNNRIVCWVCRKPPKWWKNLNLLSCVEGIFEEWKRTEFSLWSWNCDEFSRLLVELAAQGSVCVKLGTRLHSQPIARWHYPVNTVTHRRTQRGPRGIDLWVCGRSE